jgi:mannose-6-phosphate isomerase-like protein (cupin superfamily)
MDAAQQQKAAADAKSQGVNMLLPVRRIVTGHDEAGKSVFLEDGPPPQSARRGNARAAYHEIWNTQGSPAVIHATESLEPNFRAFQLPPPPQGTIIRIIDFHPGNHVGMALRADGRSSAMHRTSTIDYAVVLDGEIYAVLDDDERLMKTGDVLIQRGTDHAWQNRGERTCRMLFILIDAVFDEGLKTTIPAMLLDTVPPSLRS